MSRPLSCKTTHFPCLSFLESCINSAATLATVVISLSFPAVGLPVTSIMLLIIWGGILYLSGVEFDPGRIQYAIDFLVNLTAFFGIILGTFFGTSLVFGLLASILKDLIKWQTSASRRRG